MHKQIVNTKLACKHMNKTILMYTCTHAHALIPYRLCRIFNFTHAYTSQVPIPYVYTYMHTYIQFPLLTPSVRTQVPIPYVYTYIHTYG